MNRIDEIVVFDSLTSEQLMKIVELMLFDTQKVLNDRNIKLLIDTDVKNYLLEKGTDVKYGARPLRRAVQRYIEDELVDMILRGDLQNGEQVEATMDKEKNKVKFTVI